MTEEEIALVTYKKEADSYLGKDHIYQRVKTAVEDRISAFKQRRDAMRSRAEVHAKLAEVLLTDNYTTISIAVSVREGSNFSYNITNREEVQKILNRSRELYEQAIMNDISALDQMVEEQKKFGAPDEPWQD